MSRKYVSDFKKGEITGQHQSKKTTKDIAEIPGIGLRSVQRIIKSWKDSDEPSTSQNKMWSEKLLSSRNRRSLKRRRKIARNQLLNSQQCLTRDLSTHTCGENLKEWNSTVVDPKENHLFRR
ncbi:hypothetical protein AVEN_269132-1 [Araneus ventricosus]|uniref:Uncharacterized protein n=1 Tax=Araneus ventricosus TaxID=182803 RepID=A0A4Y2GWQ7_ARAVE|nr:hypothetical protein AVEN_269132-1 [Araneus ventricosus]